MAKSMYLESYLAVNAKRGEGKGYTVGTYLAYTLRGRAKQYISRYARALTNACEADIHTVSERSIRGGVAYRRVL